MARIRTRSHRRGAMFLPMFTKTTTAHGNKQNDHWNNIIVSSTLHWNINHVSLELSYWSKYIEIS